MNIAKSPRRSMWRGADFAQFHKIQDVPDRKEPESLPIVLDSPKFPYQPPVRADASGRPLRGDAAKAAPAPQEGDKKLLALPTSTIMNFAQSLKKPNEYPQMDGPFVADPATDAELAQVSNFLETFQFWVILARLFFKTEFYQNEWESKNKYDLVFMRLDPILIGSAQQPIYIHIAEIGIPTISTCNLDDFKVEVRGEKCTQPKEKVFNKYRRDREYTITAAISCPSVEGKAFFALTNGNTQPDPFAEKGNFKFVLKGLKAYIGLILTKVDDAFVTKEIRYRPPHVSLKYDLNDVEVSVENAPQSSPIPQQEIEQLLKKYKDNEIIAQKDKIAAQMIDIYQMRLAPLIVRLRWIHQLHDIMYFTMVNDDKVIPEFSKIQTRLVEVVFFVLSHTKIRELIFEALKKESYEPFKKLVYFRESPELRTTKKVNTLVKNSMSIQKDDLFDEVCDVIEYEKSEKKKKFRRIADLQFYIMRFFTESILI